MEVEGGSLAKRRKEDVRRHIWYFVSSKEDVRRDIWYFVSSMAVRMEFDMAGPRQQCLV